MAETVFPTSVAAVLADRAARTPDRTAYVFLAEGEEEQERLTYAGLDARARAIAAALSRSVGTGERALLLYPPGLDFVAAFFGCLYAGVIAVPAYPPRSPRMMPRLLAILADAEPAVALAAGPSLQRVRGWLERTPEGAAVSWIATDELGPAPAGWSSPAPDGDAVAFLQYTSGSTSTPKGVMVTQGNLVHNQRLIQDACGHSEESVFVSWLPVYHDLGLIGNLLQATWVGAPCVLMAPVSFLQNPSRWLRAISHYRGTTSGGPNFAYDLCARRVAPAEIGKLDLSCWQVAFNGAEPVREETLARFAEAFAPAGFRPGALYPCYGLAETTLMVSGGRPGEEAVVREVGERRLVGCGRVLSDLAVAIVDPDSGIPRLPGDVGEIWVAGGSVARGYWNRPEETAQAFGAALADGRGPWLRTGDLGALAGDELFVAGRLKDLIILRGRNHYPQDLEATAGKAHPALGNGTGAALAIDTGGEERLVIVHEVERHTAQLDEIAATVRQAIAEEHEVLVYEVVLVPAGGVPRTTSGKVQRRACRDLYLQGELRVLGASRLSPAAAAEEPQTEALPGSLDWLRRAFAAAARVDPTQVDPDLPLSASGLDSLAAVELTHAVKASTGVSLSFPDLLEGMTLRELEQQVTAGAIPPAAPLAPVAGEAAGEHPLSWNQRSLWFLHRLAPESPAYNIAIAARLHGSLEADALRRTLQAVSDRHATLRTFYATGVDGPVQRIAERVDVALVREDASGWSAEELRRRLHEEAFRPFDLERGPVFRAALLEREDDDLLVLAAHHIAADFWSFAILAREMRMLCAAGGDPQAAALPAPGVRYIDFVRRQEESLAGPRGEELQRWWRERLAGAPPLDLPSDRPRPASSSGRGTTRMTRFATARLAGLRSFAGERGATLFMALLAGLQALLARHSGQEDFVVGSPTSGRESVLWAGAVGYFVNPVALRADLSGDPTAEELLARVRQAALDAFEKADFPIALLPDRLQPRAMLTLQKATAPELAPLAAFSLGEAGARLSLGSLTLESLALENPGAQRDLTLTAAETEGGLAVSLQLDADLFDAATADRMLGHLDRVLDALVSEPHCRLSALELLTGSERRQVLAEWSGPGLRFPSEMPLHRLFAAQAARSPEAVAVSCEGRSLTYAELDRRSNRLARRLRRLGIGPESRVGLRAGRSLGLLEGLLAILKAGGAYVPLDPRLPAGRLADLAADSGVRVILAQEPLPEPLPAVVVVGLDEGDEESSDPCEDRAVAANAAYVIYTSGSTGQPKGVVVSHAEVARLLSATEPWFGFHAGDVWTQFHSFAFDFSVWEIWGAFAYGGRLVVVPYEVSRSPEAFYELLAREGVTVLNQTPSAFRQLIAAEGRRREPSELALRWVVFGGEALEPASLAPWFERRAPGVGPRLVNMYGITETTVHVTFRPLTAADAAAGSPLGVPIPDLRVYLLDRHGAPVPALVAGEIHVGGDGLARGYLNRPDLTAERFVPDPWSGGSGARLYRSGDLARWRPDGDLEYLGRIDHQVKIRGFRIEPGEIQAALAAHPEVRESVVLARAAEEGETRLVAWIVPAGGTAPPAVELRRFLRERLPEYMVPAGFVLLESLPLTANGKVDRRALPMPESVLSVRDRAVTPPADPMEEVLAGIWADLLQVDRVGREDDFFELGGDSLRATRVAARLRDALDVELPLVSLFTQTTLAELAEKVRQVRRAGGSPPAPRVARAPRDGAIPLSFFQESLWFLDRLAPDVPVYHLPAAVRLRGPLDPAALAAALTGIAERHEVLRTVFATVDGHPCQVVLPPAPVPLPLVETGVEEAWRLAAAEALRPFDLERGPLLRALLVRCAPEDHLLVLVLHHAVADGWSVSLFLREIEALYAGLPARLPELPVQYADYAVWQRQRLTGAVLAEQLSWWRERLADAPPMLDLPIDRPRRAVPSFRGSSHPVQLPADLSTALRGLARRQGGTLFMALLAGFAALLHRYSGQDDLTIGAPFANRPRTELEPLIGFFVSSLPLRASLADDPGGAELLARLRTETLGASEHRDLPVDRLIEELHLRRDPACSPLFQVMLAVEDGAVEPLALPGCTAEIVPLGTGTAKLDLTLALAASGAELTGELEISADLFEPATAERLIGHFTALLRGLVAEPGRPVSHLPLVAEAEREALVSQARGAAPRGGEACLHDLVAAQAQRSPDAVAVESAGESLTYRELRQRAAELAECLQALGIGPDIPVGLCAERTPSLVVGILGILTAGGAYLPLDPELPRERRRSLLSEASASCVITDAHYASEWADTPVRVLTLGAAESPHALPVTTRRPWAEPAVTPDHLACILSTSGSTGRPKMVAVPHRGLVNRLTATVEAFGIASGDAILQRTSISFDVSIGEIFTALIAGARLVQVPPGDHRDPAALRRLASEHGISFLDFVPSLLEAFLDGGGPLPALRGVFVGGEALPSALAARCAAVLGWAPVNMYGPTEASIDVLWHTWQPGDAARATVPLGRPIAGCTVAVLDRHLEPVPAGVPGELWIGGACLARGYLGRHDLTAERFLPDPAATEPGARLYRTGDLTRRLADGEIEFLGRVDHQVKIRGIRVEPAEVEAALRVLEGVRDAAVVAVGSGSDLRLAAYVVPADPAAPPRSLRAALAGVLPEALVPSSFTLLAALPRTAGGKLDRRSLPEPERGAAAERIAPRTPVEARLATIWAALLGVPEVGIEDSFFELGGHSLLAAQVISRVHAELGTELSVRALFERPTVAAFAAAVEEASRTPAPPPVLHRRPAQTAQPPLSPAQERLWFLDRLEPGNPAYNVPLAFRLRGPLSAARLAASLTAVAGRHEALRATFSESAGRPRQEISLQPRFPLATFDLTGLPPAVRQIEAMRRAGEEARHPFDLAAGPLCRAVLLRLQDQDHLLVLVVHHIVFDGWSAGILLRELELLAAAAALPPLPVQYADYAVWVNEWLDSGALAAQLAGWRERLAGAPATLDLPTDRRRPAVQTFRGGAVPVMLPAELVRGLRTLARERGATLFMAVLAGWSALLHRSSGAPEVVVGTPVANRKRPEWEGVIGLFVNTLPLRIDLAGDPLFAEVLDRVRGAALAAYESQDVPFEHLVEAVGTERDLARSPLFQVMLALADGAPSALRLPGVTVEEVPLHNSTAKLELLLALQDEKTGAAGVLSGGLEFNADLFDAATARRLADRFVRLLTGAVAAPRLRIGDLPLLDAAEELQIVVGWNTTEAPFPRDLGLHELFEAQAARTPRATALIHGTQRVSYGELDAWADRLARRLGTLGVGPEMLVGVFCGRTPGMVAAALAVLKAGGAYLPLDPAYPADRLAFLLADAGAAVVLTEENVAAALPPFAGRLVLVDQEAGRPKGTKKKGKRPRGFFHPDQTAYAIYTSGSTGVPKGVLVRHGSAVARITWALAAYPRDVLAGVLAATSLCFDLSVFEIFVPLAAGGAAVLADNALALPSLPAASAVTLVNTVPSAMAELVRAGALPPSVRVVNLAGEPLRRDLAARVYALEGVEDVHNLYGPSEDTTYSTSARVERTDEREPAIGRPLPNTRIHLLDTGRRVVPVGAPGELWLGGEGLARGYLRRPDLTADHFRPDPFGTSSGGRLYRTGDLARRRADGAIDYLGRLDHQVKVRGFRVELGEVEAVLLAHPEVREAVVVVREDTPGDRRLIAYLTGNAGDAGSLTADALRRSVRERLPDYMVPAAFVTLAALPLTPSGKVDRKALPAPEWQGEGAGAPRTPVEEVLAGLWAEVLGRERVAATDHFFHLGGHSLLATRVMSRLRSAFGLEMPLREIFEAPVLADLAARVEAALRTGAGLAAPPLVAVPREGASPLSFAQQRLWFLEQLEPGSPLYNLSVALRAEGPLDAAVLCLCLREIIRRHEALRTVFAASQGVPMQVVQPAGPFRLPVVDLSGLAESRREKTALSLAGNEAAHPFDLGRGPLLRGLLLRLAAEHHITALTLHHIASDGWSMGVLLREVTALYKAFIASRPSPLPDLPVQYADFAVWQQSWLHGEILDSEISFWRRQLAGLPSLLELPADRPRLAVQSFRGASRPVRLPADLTRQIAALCRREGATPFMVLLAGFQALLARYSGQQDLAVGTPVAGRKWVEIEGLVGFFVNTLVLRGDLSGAPSFRELLGRVRETALSAYVHQDVPFEKLVEELAPERSLAHAPLFQVMLALQNAPAGSLEIGDLRLRPLHAQATASRFDLTLSLEPQGDGLAGMVEHSTDLFDATTIERLSGCFERLLAAAVALPERRAAELPLISAAELHQVLTEWNDTERAEIEEESVPLLVERRARARPADPAVVDAMERVLTYGELDEQAGRLAAFLRTLGVGPETVVGVLAESSPELVAGLLGVLKAGAAYLPLDPSHPAERLSLILAESAAPVVLTQEALRGRLPDARARIICLDGDWEESGHFVSIPATRVEPDSLAYVIYTSGSTGRPKGVQVPHRGLINLVRWDLRAYGTGPGDRRTHVASLGFDASAWEIWPCLASGAALHIPAAELRPDPPRLAAWIAERRITVSFLPTPLAEALMAAQRPEFPALRRLLVGGDRLRLHPDPSCGFSLVNHYGPTEASVVTSAGTVPSRARGEVGPAPSLGRPIDGLRIYLLDRSLLAVPLGVPGELWVGGPSLARGYLGDPGRTAEWFAPDPFGRVPGGRLYRTGDLCRHRRDGSLEFLGRLDHQVKIRGFRIELGEIEAAVTRHPGIRDAVAILWPAEAGAQLVAYLVPAGERTPEGNALRDFLRASLPEPMIPTAFVTLSLLPLTSNGKVDRKALPPPEMAGTVVSAHFAAPRTPVEELLAGVWAEVLGLERVDIHQSFFDLGGHSLIATRVVSRLRSVCGVELPVRALFERPTVAELSAAVEEARRCRAGRSAPPPVPVPRTGDLPLSFAQERLWFLDRLQPESPFYNMPLALELRGTLSLPLFAASLAGIFARHEALRTTFRLVEGSAGERPIQVIAPALNVPSPLVDLAGLPAALRASEVARLAREEAARPFNLARGPLLRTTILRLEDEAHVALLNQHHIVSDGWSVGVLVEELTARYRVLAAGQPPALPDLPIQYADYAVWQRAWLGGDVLEARLRWWRERLAGAPHQLDLPADRSRPAVQSLRGGHLSFALPSALSAALRETSRRQGTTLFMTLASLFAAVLSRQTGAADLLLGSPIAGRDRAETERLIGLFVNTLVLRAEMADDPTFAEILGRMREMTLGAYAHQDLPFEKLVDSLQPERSLAHTPLFQVMIVLQNTPLGTLGLPGLTLKSLPVESGTARFDLLLSAVEEAGRITGDMEYSRDVFDPATIARLLGHLRVLAAGAVSQPEARLSALPLLSEPEIHQLHREWNDTAAEGWDEWPETPGRLGVHQLVAAQVRRTPDAPAVACQGRELTYAELSDRSAHLARRLRALGCEPETRVGIFLERSLDIPVALLGILASGAAYVPLDPGYPSDRLAFILEDAAPRVLITQEHLLPSLPPARGTVLCLDAMPPGGGPAAGPPLPWDDRQLAYVLYTSGSTGRPKGVGVSHRSLINFLDSMRRTPGFTQGERLLAVTSLSFDIAALEIFLPLSAGGCVELASRAETSDGILLAARIRAARAGVLQATPATWRMLLDTGWPGDPGLRALCGGEALPRDLAVSLAGRVRELWNLYGPTETTVWSATARIRPDGTGSISIGRPIANTRIHLLGREMQPVPLGVPGELWIGGTGLARGYLARPDLTAERFVPDPLAAGMGESGGRLYRTGDLARHLPGGRMEILGRIDQQIKLRGYRIELGEIEVALVALSGIHEAVVVARQGTAGDRRLVAYVVSDAAVDSAAEDALRQSLRERLPDFMVPAAFVRLAALPLTPNGKVDRKTLPAPEWQSVEKSFLPPRTPAEEILAGIWSETLGLERVGANDRFFDLGGHSLLATRVMSRLRSALGIEMPLRDLFEAPRLADLAARIEEALRDGKGVLTPALVPMPREGPVPLSFAQERLWFLYLLEPESSAFHLGGAVRLTGALAPGAFAASLSEIVRRHEVLRTRYQACEDGPVQIVDPPAPFPSPLIDLCGLPEGIRERELRRLAEREMARPFDLTRDWPLRTHLVRLSPEEHATLFTLHHIAGDGWSLSLLTRELGALYAASAGHPPAALPRLVVQYADFAVWQRCWLSGERLEEQLAWWRDHLAGPLPVLELPQWRRRPDTPGFRGAACPLTVPSDLRRKLEKIGLSEGATLFMTLLAGFKALLHLCSGQENLLVGTSIANRDRSEVEGLIGFFVNNLALRTDLSGNPGFRELVRRVRKVTLGAFAHQEVPFEKVLEAVQPGRRTAFSPLFQVMFVLDNFPAPEWRAGGLEIAALDLEARTVNFHLTLRLREGASGLAGALHYDTDLFAEDAMARMAEHFLALLHSVAEDPDRPLSAIPLTDESDIRQLASAFSEDY
jgi:amino acid adenylation domain-containing protein